MNQKVDDYVAVLRANGDTIIERETFECALRSLRNSCKQLIYCLNSPLHIEDLLAILPTVTAMHALLNLKSGMDFIRPITSRFGAGEEVFDLINLTAAEGSKV